MTGSLQKKNNVWYAVINTYDGDGKRKLKWISTGKKKKPDAQKVLTEILSKMDKKTYIDPVKILFSDFMLDWLDNIIKSHIEQTTWEGYTTNIRVHIEPYFKAKRLKLSEITAMDLQQYFNQKLNEGLSACYIKKHHANIKKALDYAAKLGLINSNPIQHVTMPRIKKHDAKYYTIEQLEQLLTITKDSNIESAVFLTVHYGFRRGEALGLRWSDINFKEGTLKVCNTRTRVAKDVEKKPKSESSIRTLPLIPRVTEYLKALKEKQEEDKRTFGNCYNDNDYICRYSDGTPVNVNTINHAFKRTLENNNMPHIRFHDLRHSTASFLIKNGLSLKEIQIWLGHSDISITANIYTHVDSEMKKNTASKINELFSTTS